MGVIKGAVPDELERKFREAAMKRFGFGKGALGKALEEAIYLWLSQAECGSRVDEERRINNEAYRRVVNELVSDENKGKYCVLCYGKIAAAGDTPLEAARKAMEAFPEAEHLLVFQVGGEAAKRRRLGWRIRRATF